MKTMMMMTAIALVGLLLNAGCSGAPEPEQVAPEQDVGSLEQALAIGNPGVASCPGGGSPSCVACDGGECVQACTGGYTCDTESWDVEGGEATSCKLVGNCLTFSFGNIAGGGGLFIF